MLALHQNHISCWAWCPADAELFAVATQHKAGGAACGAPSEQLAGELRAAPGRGRR